MSRQNANYAGSVSENAPILLITTNFHPQFVVHHATKNFKLKNFPTGIPLWVHGNMIPMS